MTRPRGPTRKHLIEPHRDQGRQEKGRSSENDASDDEPDQTIRRTQERLGDSGANGASHGIAKEGQRDHGRDRQKGEDDPRRLKQNIGLAHA